MKRLIWSSEKIRSDFPGCQNLQELITAIEEVAGQDGDVVCDVFVNGMRLLETDEKKFSETGLSDIREVEVGAETVDVVLAETINSAIEYIDRLKGVCIKNADLFRTDDLSHAQSLFETVLDGAGWVVEMATEIRRVAAEKQWASDGASWLESEDALTQRTRTLLAALETRDYVLVADILEYDWTSALDLWLKYFATVGPGSKNESKETSDHLGG